MVDISYSRRAVTGGTSLSNTSALAKATKLKNKHIMLFLFTFFLLLGIYVFYCWRLTNFPLSENSRTKLSQSVVLSAASRNRKNETATFLEGLSGIWTTRANEGISDFRTYANTALQGSYAYDEVGPDRCRLHSLSRTTLGSMSQIPCTIHFPYADLNDLISQQNVAQQKSVTLLRREQIAIDRLVPQPIYVPTSADEHRGQQGFSQNMLNSSEYALLTRGGKKGKATGVKVNQDRAFFFSVPPDNHSSNRISQEFVLGLFDGHGTDGHIVSNFASLDLIRLLYEKLTTKRHQNQQKQHQRLTQEQEQDIVKEAIEETFMQLDELLPERDELLSSGSTAFITLRLESTPEFIYVANLGDSATFIATYDSTKRIHNRNDENENDDKSVNIIFQTQGHKPHLPLERERIEKAGGQISVPPFGSGASSRIIIPLPNGAFALAMSRSLGDKAGKGIGLIAKPTINVIDLREIGKNSNDDNIGIFVVAATDGLFDYVSPTFVARHLAKSLYHHEENGQDQNHQPRTLLESCEQLIMKASASWESAHSGLYRDDITIAVTKINR